MRFIFLFFNLFLVFSFASGYISAYVEFKNVGNKTWVLPDNTGCKNYVKKYCKQVHYPHCKYLSTYHYYNRYRHIHYYVCWYQIQRPVYKCPPFSHKVGSNKCECDANFVPNHSGNRCICSEGSYLLFDENISDYRCVQYHKPKNCNDLYGIFYYFCSQKGLNLAFDCMDTMTNYGVNKCIDIVGDGKKCYDDVPVYASNSFCYSDGNESNLTKIVPHDGYRRFTLSFSNDTSNSNSSNSNSSSSSNSNSSNSNSSTSDNSSNSNSSNSNISDPLTSSGGSSGSSGGSSGNNEFKHCNAGQGAGKDVNYNIDTSGLNTLTGKEDSLFSGFNKFKDNVKSDFDSLFREISKTKDVFRRGFKLDIHKNDNLPVCAKFRNPFNGKEISIDFCPYISPMAPIIALIINILISILSILIVVKTILRFRS